MRQFTSLRHQRTTPFRSGPVCSFCARALAPYRLDGVSLLCYHCANQRLDDVMEEHAVPVRPENAARSSRPGVVGSARQKLALMRKGSELATDAPWSPGGTEPDLRMVLAKASLLRNAKHGLPLLIFRIVMLEERQVSRTSLGSCGARF